LAMVWKTYLIMYFGTNGNSLREVVGKVEELGFNSELGPVDFVYEWGENEPSKEEIFDLGDKLVGALKGTNVVFNLDTHD
jgi:hypothetical protein